MTNRSRIALTLITTLSLCLLAPLTASAQDTPSGGGGGAGGFLSTSSTTTGPTTTLGLTIGGIVLAVRSSKSKQTALAYYLDDNRPEVQQTLALGHGGASDDLAAYFSTYAVELDQQTWQKILRENQKELNAILAKKGKLEIEDAVRFETVIFTALAERGLLAQDAG
jgi:hypothetical protein